MFEWYVPIARVDEGLLRSQVVQAGLPLVGSVTRTAAGVLILTSRDLTPAEVTTLEGVVTAHTPRRPRAVVELATALTGLPADQRLKVLCAAAAVVLQSHPQLARALGVAFDADEPDPGS